MYVINEQRKQMKESSVNFLVGNKEPTGTEWLAIAPTRKEAEVVKQELLCDTIRKVTSYKEVQDGVQ